MSNEGKLQEKLKILTLPPLFNHKKVQLKKDVQLKRRTIKRITYAQKKFEVQPPMVGPHMVRK